MPELNSTYQMPSEREPTYNDLEEDGVSVEIPRGREGLTSLEEARARLAVVAAAGIASPELLLSPEQKKLKIITDISNQLSGPRAFVLSSRFVLTDDEAERLSAAA